jgi:hypothetical protein
LMAENCGSVCAASSGLALVLGLVSFMDSL